LGKASRIELSIRRFAALAVKGDVASAAWLLKMRAHAKDMATPARRSSGSPVGSQRHSADSNSNGHLISAPAQIVNGDASMGQQLVQKWCNDCHAVGAQMPKLTAPYPALF